MGGRERPRATDSTVTMLAGFFVATSFALGYMMRVWVGFSPPEALAWAHQHYLASGLIYLAGSGACSAIWYYTARVYYEIFS